jgi:ribosomal protein S18 acetylase RimI-like enzyme
MTIRPAVAADVPVVLEFWPRAGASPSPTDNTEDLRRVLDCPTAILLIAEGEGKLMGTLIATFDGWRAHIFRLAIDPLARRRGIARALVDEAEQLLSQWGAKRVIALVELDHPWAISFWEAIGYAHDPNMQRHFKALAPRPSQA